MIEMCGKLYNLQVEISALKHLLEGTTIDQEVDVSVTIPDLHYGTYIYLTAPVS